MERTINIGGIEVRVATSLRTILDYKHEFGEDLFKDIAKLNTSSKDISEISDVINVLFQLIYVMHKPFTKKSYPEFLEQFDFNVISDEVTLKEVTSVISTLFQSQDTK